MRALARYFFLLTAALYFTAPSFASTYCATSAKDAALTYVQGALSDGRDYVDVLEPNRLRQFRARLQQLLDDQYAPASSGFRERMLGETWTIERLSALSDREFFLLYHSSGAERRRGLSISKLGVSDIRRDQFGDTLVAVFYDVEGRGNTVNQRRELRAVQRAQCWLIELSLESRVNLELIAKFLKESRKNAELSRHALPRVSLQVAEASDFERPGFRSLPRRSGDNNVWVREDSLLTGEDVATASASWDCENGLEPEDPAVRLTFTPGGAEKLQKWTLGRYGTMLAVVVDGQVVLYARIAGNFGAALSLCLPGGKLEDAQKLAADVLGRAR